MAPDPLHTADLTTIEGLKSVLLSYKVNSMIDPEDVAGNTSFFFESGQYSLLENLMYADHDVKEATFFLLKRKASTRYGDPLAHAAYTGNLAAIELLLASKALINGNGGKNSSGMVPLLSAAKNPSNPGDTTNLLLTNKALVLNKKDKKTGRNFFHIAALAAPARGSPLGVARSEDDDIALIEQRLFAVEAVAKQIQDRIAAGARISNFINGKDKYGNTALMYASSVGDVALIRLLLKYGASRTAKNPEGKTAVDVFNDTEEEKKEAFKRVYKGKRG